MRALEATDTGATTGPPPLVLLHAFPLDGRMWDAQVAALAGGRRVIVADLPGFGRSPPTENPAGCTVDAFAGAVAALLAAKGVERAVVAGLSMGGYVAFALHRRHPALVAGLVLADTRADADTPERRANRERQQAQVLAGGAGALAPAMVSALLGPTTLQHRPEVVAAVRTLIEAQPPQGIIGALEALKTRPDATGQLGTIAVPTLVIGGSEDALSPPEVATAMHDAIAGSRLAILEGAGHLTNLEVPVAFNAAVTGFLEGL
ncbi:MAG: alpha/beta fold hydrolase [Acidimicrobiales bacterium]